MTRLNAPTFPVCIYVRFQYNLDRSQRLINGVEKTDNADISCIMHSTNDGGIGMTKDEYLKKFQETIDEQQAKLEQLRAKALDETQDAIDDIREAIEDLEPKIEKAKAKAMEMAESADESWDEMMASAEQGWNEMKKAFDDNWDNLTDSIKKMFS